jgi:hypothetical protein
MAIKTHTPPPIKMLMPSAKYTDAERAHRKGAAYRRSATVKIVNAPINRPITCNRLCSSRNNLIYPTPDPATYIELGDGWLMVAVGPHKGLFLPLRWCIRRLTSFLESWVRSRWATPQRLLFAKPPRCSSLGQKFFRFRVCRKEHISLSRISRACRKLTSAADGHRDQGVPS